MSCSSRQTPEVKCSMLSTVHAFVHIMVGYYSIAYQIQSWLSQQTTELKCSMLSTVHDFVHIMVGYYSIAYQIQSWSSQHMKVVKEHPWHRLQLEHIRPSAHIPYLNYTFLQRMKKNCAFYPKTSNKSPLPAMVLMLDGNSEIVASARRKIGLFRKKKPDLWPNQMPLPDQIIRFLLTPLFLSYNLI